MKSPDKKGTVSSFFTYFDGPGFSPADWNELDIEIVPSVEHNPLSMNMIYGDGESDKVESHEYAHGFNPHDEWHTYTMEWTPDYVSWSVDGHEVRHANGTHAVSHMHQPQSLRMNFWTPTFDSWGHDLDPADMPWYVLYDYVEVHVWDEQANEFNLHWRDDFDSFDSSRWHKATGSFEANSSVFYPSNVSCKAGHLVLKMEPDEDHEFNDTTHYSHDTHRMERLGKHFPKQTLHAHHQAVSDSIEIPPVHDAFVDSHLFGKHAAETRAKLVDHSDKEYIDHHDDYYLDRQGELVVEHKDVHHVDTSDDWEIDHLHSIHHPHHPHSHPHYEHEAHYETDEFGHLKHAERRH